MTLPTILGDMWICANITDGRIGKEKGRRACAALGKMQVY